MPVTTAAAATAATAAAAATFPVHSFKLITTTLFPRPLLRRLRFATAAAAAAASTSASVPSFEEPPSTPPQQQARSTSYFPKKNQTLELECEGLAYKGKGICKVSGSGFVLLCDRALPGERFVGRVTRKKGNYAEVTKLRTISPHWDIVDAPCEYASYCGGCKTQNLSYEAQVRAKEQQVRELIIHVGKFPSNDPEFPTMMKPIIPCDIQFHYRNKMEFSFGSQRWLPRELFEENRADTEKHALGLHAPGFFDKVLNVNKCLLQSDPANKVLAAIQDCWRDPLLGTLRLVSQR
ncbi:hypothetical protein BT93_D0266 [Corymbia citriodora subsp. variegata]|nr:hypothetical protein BT93_D0266 [Corymbia citriodora subsp. variegata]